MSAAAGILRRARVEVTMTRKREDSDSDAEALRQPGLGRHRRPPIRAAGIGPDLFGVEEEISLRPPGTAALA